MMDVKSYKYSINTGDTGIAQDITSKINGCLSAIKIKCDKPVNVTLRLDDLPSVVIWSVLNCPLEDYVLIAKNVHDQRNDKFTYEAEEWVLDDKVIIDVSGSKNASIEVTLVVC